MYKVDKEYYNVTYCTTAPDIMLIWADGMDIVGQCKYTHMVWTDKGDRRIAMVTAH